MDSIKNELTFIQTSLTTFIPVVLALCFIVYGLMMAAADHSKAKQNIFYAFIGGAVALGAPAIAASIHP